MKKIIIGIVFISLFYMCDSPKNESLIRVDNSEYVAEKIDETNQSNTTNSVVNNDRKLIKNGTLFIETKALKETKNELAKLIKDYSGYSSEEDFQDNDYQISVNYIIRIPAVSFDNFLLDIEKTAATIIRKQVKIQDITSEFIDLKVRLTNKEAYLERYRQLLTKANSIKEVLEIENQIRVLEEELELVKERVKHISSQVEYSTLTIHITQQKDYNYTPVRESFWQRSGNALSKGWSGFVEFLLVMLTLWPFVFIFSVLIYCWIKYKRRKRNSKTSKL